MASAYERLQSLVFHTDETVATADLIFKTTNEVLEGLEAHPSAEDIFRIAEDTLAAIESTQIHNSELIALGNHVRIVIGSVKVAFATVAASSLLSNAMQKFPITDLKTELGDIKLWLDSLKAKKGRKSWLKILRQKENARKTEDYIECLKTRAQQFTHKTVLLKAVLTDRVVRSVENSNTEQSAVWGLLPGVDNHGLATVP